MRLQSVFGILIGAAATILIHEAAFVHADNDPACPGAWSVGSDEFICPADFSPVVCVDGSNLCEYSNQCVSSTAGVSGDCCLKCPNPTWPSADAGCDEVSPEDEVVCQRECMEGITVDCTYQSLCYAEAAGLEQTQCYEPGQQPEIQNTLATNAATGSDGIGSTGKATAPAAVLQVMMVVAVCYGAGMGR